MLRTIFTWKDAKNLQERYYETQTRFATVLDGIISAFVHLLKYTWISSAEQLRTDIDALSVRYAFPRSTWYRWCTPTWPVNRLNTSPSCTNTYRDRLCHIISGYHRIKWPVPEGASLADNELSGRRNCLFPYSEATVRFAVYQMTGNSSSVYEIVLKVTAEPSGGEKSNSLRVWHFRSEREYVRFTTYYS